MNLKFIGVKLSGKIMSVSTALISPQVIFEESVVRQAHKITADQSHVLTSEYELFQSCRRYTIPL